MILVMDDDDDLRGLLAEALTSYGLEVSSWRDGKAALVHLEGLARDGATLPQAIVADLIMPGMNGKEFLKALSNQPALAAIPIVVYTGWKLRPDERSELPSAVVEVLLKPVDIETLVEAIHQASGSWRAKAP